MRLSINPESLSLSLYVSAHSLNTWIDPPPPPQILIEGCPVGPVSHTHATNSDRPGILYRYISSDDDTSASLLIMNIYLNMGKIFHSDSFI